MKSHELSPPTMRQSGLPIGLKSVLGRDLARAIEQGEIEVRFQPQFSTDKGKMIGAEALSRWQHPVVGEIGGSDLFSVAQRSGLTAKLSRHVVDLAFLEAARWPQELKLSVNITPEEISDPAFAAELTGRMMTAGIAPARVTFEITEDTLVGNLNRSARALEAIAATGARIALDDFGAGFCNFEYLKRLPINILKLDRSMVRGITRSERDMAVFRAILRLAEALDLETVAEGIETEGQRQAVVAEGCDAWQGFLWAEPLGVKQMRTLATV